MRFWGVVLELQQANMYVAVCLTSLCVGNAAFTDCRYTSKADFVSPVTSNCTPSVSEGTNLE